MPEIGGMLEMALRPVAVSAKTSPNSNSIILTMEQPMPTIGGIALVHPKLPPGKPGTPVGTIQVTLNDGTKASGILLATGFNAGFTIIDAPAPPAPPPAPPAPHLSMPVDLAVTAPTATSVNVELDPPTSGTMDTGGFTVVTKKR